MGCTLDQVADARLYVERSRIFLNPAGFRLSDPILRMHGRFTAQAATATVQSFRLKDVILDAQQGVLLRDSGVITDTCFFVAPDYQPNPDPQQVIRLPDGFDYILGYNKMAFAYHHWLMQCMPSIDWGLRLHGDRQAVLVLPELQPWQNEMINLLGYGQVPRVTVENGKFYAFPQIDYAEYLNGKPSFSIVPTLYGTVCRMLDHLAPAATTGQILYVPCSIPHYGEVDNEPAVIDLLRRSGVTILDLSLGTEARLNLFRNADVILGPHGTNLADILFTRPGTLLWEWTPSHYQNPIINRLAQTAQADYWGDVFESEAGSHYPKAWSVDLQVVRRRLVEISGRLAHVESSDHQHIPYNPVQPNGKPLDDLMLAFENLGENCDFGLIQRHAGVEPLGIFRFAGIRLDQLLNTLANEFDGVGDPANMEITLFGDDDRREFMISERSVGGYHTFIYEGEMERAELLRRQARRLTFLRRKVLDDLRAGEKIWVWRESVPSPRARIDALLGALNRFGPNKLLWVTVAKGEKPPGTVERLAHDLVRGYALPFGGEVVPPGRPWFQVCEEAYYVWHPEERDTENVPVWQ